jgi:hypothetical protein
MPQRKFNSKCLLAALIAVGAILFSAMAIATTFPITLLSGSWSQLISQIDYTLGSLASGDSDTRSTTATYVNSSGGISTAAINTARFDWTGGSANGWLVESASTNNFQDSNYQGWWVTQNGATITANAAVSPDGTSDAAILYFPLSTSRSISPSVSQTGLQSYSVWVQGTVGGEKIYLTFYNVTNGQVNSGTFTLTTAWSRISAPFTPTSASQWYIFNGSGVAQTINIYGAQLEPGGVVSSLIPTTTAAATRAADIAANANWWNGSTGNYLMVESMSEATGVISRASYCASGCTGTSFVAPSAVLIKRICRFNATPSGASAAITEAAQANGTACS